MKKSGTLTSWFLFGLIANFLFVLVSEATLNFAGFLMSGILFLAFRIIIDWEANNNIVEDELREIYVSSHIVDNLLFASLASFILLFSNKFLFSNLGIAFVLGVACVLITHLVFENTRVWFNQQKELHLMTLKNKLLRKN